MFEKLLSVLPYNPSMAHQLAFYSRRMREESAIRRTGMVFMVLAFVIQFMAVLSPPQPTTAASSNDLINGGISSAADAKHHCNQNDQHYGDILNYYGISCDDIGGAPTVTLQSTEGAHYYSMGRNSYGQRNPNTGRQTNETPINIPGPQGRVYVRLLHSFDGGAYTSYQALKVKSKVTGDIFYILYDCGNLVSVGVPHAVDRCKYDNRILATSNKCFKPCKWDSSIPADSNRCFQPCKWDNTIPTDSNRCFQPCPLKGLRDVPKDSKKCHEQVCPYNKNIKADSPKCQGCLFNPAVSADSPQCQPPVKTTENCQYDPSLPANSPDCFPPCPYNNSVPADSDACKPCEDSLSSSNPAACVAIHKTASNITANISDANNTTVNPGDVINYVLSAHNTGKADVDSFVFQESLSDVLDYADVTDLHGGTMSDDGLVSWPAETIKAGTTVKHEITVKVKDPVPQTPAAPGDPNHFDLVMTNVYGDTVNIMLPGSIEKTIEVTADTLPNTGPGTTLFIAGAIVIAAGYFYSRSRLLSIESSLAVQENAVA